jgi:hypothetical protein
MHTHRLSNAHTNGTALARTACANPPPQKRQQRIVLAQLCVPQQLLKRKTAQPKCKQHKAAKMAQQLQVAANRGKPSSRRQLAQKHISINMNLLLLLPPAQWATLQQHHLQLLLLLLAACRTRSICEAWRVQRQLQ